MKDSPPLTPERLLRLYTQMPVHGERLGTLVGEAFRLNPESREWCAHLLPLFVPKRRQQVTLWDVYQVHYRWAGRKRWLEIWDDAAQPVETAAKALQATESPLRWGMVEAACETSRRLAAADGSNALALARAALAAAATVPTDVLGERCRQELLALAHATVANAHRVLDQLEPARAAMRMAERCSKRAHPSLLELAPEILARRASIEYWERDFSGALATVDEALAQKPDSALRGRLLINQARLLIDFQRPTNALGSLQKALALIRREDDPRLWCCAVQNRLLVLSELGRLDEAAAELQQVRVQVAADAAPIDLLQVAWVEARIAAGRGQAATAEDLYRQVHQGFLDHQLPFSAAVVTLEWCRLLLAEGRLEEVKQRAISTLAEFHRQQVEPEIISALALVEQAVLGQRLTQQVLTRARALLDRQARG
jgi:tetratricopeptide (TPR) repeat protein